MAEAGYILAVIVLELVALVATGAGIAGIIYLYFCKKKQNNQELDRVIIHDIEARGDEASDYVQIHIENCEENSSN